MASTIPDSARLPPTSIETGKSLRRLSREAMIDLALKWLEPENQPLCAPTLDPDADAIDPTLASGSLPTIVHVRQRFESASKLKDSRKEILEAVQTHWPAGLTLKQWAMVDEARIMAEVAEDGAPGGMQWMQFGIENQKVDYGEVLAGYVRDDDNSTTTLRIKPALLMHDLQTYLGPLVKTHVRLLQPSSRFFVLRVVCFGDDTSSTSDGQLLNADSPKVLYLAFEDVCRTIYASPLNIKLDGDDSPSLVVQALEKLLSSDKAKIQLVTKSSAKSTTSWALFNGAHVYPNAQKSFADKSGDAVGSEGKATASKSKINPEKRRRIKELQNAVRFRGATNDVETEDGDE